MYEQQLEFDAKHKNKFELVFHYANADGSSVNLWGIPIISDLKDRYRKLIQSNRVSPIDLTNGLFMVIIDEVPLTFSGLYMDLKLRYVDRDINLALIKINVKEIVTYG